ncbi:Uncharacterized protein FKW44_006949, partial [Caligus rogercresseyi]
TFLQLKRINRVKGVFNTLFVCPPTPFYTALINASNKSIYYSINKSLIKKASVDLVKKRLQRFGCSDSEEIIRGSKKLFGNTLTSRKEKWFRYRMSTSSLFTNKSMENKDERNCNFCCKETET